MANYLIRVGVTCFIILLFLIIGALIWDSWYNDMSISDGICNVALIPIEGEVSPGAFASLEGTIITDIDDTRALILRAENDPYIKALMVQIDSTGGYAAGAELVANTLKNSTLPSVAVIRETGASAAYLIATGADRIYASPFSDVGSIGVTMSYVENWQQNDDSGLSYVQLSSAPYKDYGNPNKQLTEDERALLERDLAIWHEELVNQIARNRNLPVEEMMKISDGSSVPGEKAKELKLIDEVGDEYTAIEWLSKELNFPKEQLIICR
jgi:protease IV